MASVRGIAQEVGDIFELELAGLADRLNLKVKGQEIKMAHLSFS